MNLAKMHLYFSRGVAVLRNKADYNPFSNISPKELNEAIIHMEKIFGQLEFE